VKKGLTDLQKSVRPFSIDKFFSTPVNQSLPVDKSAKVDLPSAINLLSNREEISPVQPLFRLLNRRK
jgi:hypothetical protein